VSPSSPASDAAKHLVGLGDSWEECPVCEDDGRADQMLPRLLAIEAQARRDALLELRGVVEGLEEEHCFCCDMSGLPPEAHSDFSPNVLNRDQVLAAIDRQLGASGETA
jgi:hypothetical protein